MKIRHELRIGGLIWSSFSYINHKVFLPPKVRGGTIEQTRKLLAKPDDFVPGGNLIAAYGVRGKAFIVCIWDAPSTEAFCPFVEQLDLAGWDTDIMPAEKMTVRVERLAKALKVTKK